MRRQTFGPTGRRGTVIAASAAVLCLGGALTGCGGSGGGHGYTAVGAADTGPTGAPRGAVGPSGSVTLVPLNGGGDGGGDGSGDGSTSPSGSMGNGPTGDAGPSASGNGTLTGTRTPGATGPSATAAAGDSDGAGGAEGTTGGTSPAPPEGPGAPADSDDPADPATPSAPGTTPPAAPAALQLSAPVRAPADRRWCEQVTVGFRNTGGTAARSGTVTFATHIIGGLGIDWATVKSTQPLPAPIDAGAVRKKAYTVCVDAWRVPLGMRIETQDVTAVWR